MRADRGARDWAEGVQDYLNVHQTHDPTDINTKDALEAYDPTLYGIVDRVFHDVKLPPACPVPSFDESAWYRVENAELGAAYSLDTANDGGSNAPRMAARGGFSGEYWRLSPTGDGHFRLTNAFLGHGRALHTNNDGVNDPAMAATGRFSGQLWKVTAVDGGHYRLTNEFLGDGRALATTVDNHLVLAPSADDPRQLWALERIP